MAFTQFSDDMDIIARLPDNPNDDGGLTAAQLKAKFDQGPKAIKTYINGTLLGEVGDMKKADYDADGDGKVEAADLADEATKLTTARTITVGSKANTFDGSANISFTLADMGAAAASVATTASLPAASWVGNAQTVSVTGVTASNHVIVTPAADSYVEWGGCVVRCTAQGAGTLTFACETTPTNALTANVLIVG